MAAVTGISSGIPYCWGSDSPLDAHPATDLCPLGHGLDCSGLVIWSWREAGVSVGDYSAQGLYDLHTHTTCTLTDLAAAGGTDGATCWAIGDLVFLGYGHSITEIYHVAMYIGGRSFADCYNTSVGCVVWEVDQKLNYQADFAGAARPSAAWGGGSCGDTGIVSGLPGGTPGTGGGVTAIGAKLQTLASVEPIGTLIDVGGFFKYLSVSIAAPDLSVPAVVPASDGGAYSGVLSPFSYAAVIAGASSFLDWLADSLDAASIAGISGLDLVYLMSTVACAFLIFRYVRARFVVTT